MGPIEALKIAMMKEIEAIEVYQKFAQEYTVAKDIFLFLVGEEEKHKLLIEKKIFELTK